MCLVSRCLRSTVTPSENEERKKNVVTLYLFLFVSFVDESKLSS